MTATLHKISSEPPAEEALEMLETMIDRVKRGEISCVAIAAVTRDGSATTGWSRVHSYPATIGAIHMLAARIQNQWLGNE